MHRYVKKIGSVGVIDVAEVDAFMVIRTDEVPPAEVLAKGFEPIEEGLSDDEVKARYHVACIYEVRDERAGRARG